MDFLKRMFSGVIKAGALALARHVATLAGAALLTWLLSHHVGSDLAGRLVDDVQDIIITGAAAALVAAGVGSGIKVAAGAKAQAAVAASAAYDTGRAHGLQEGIGAQAAADNAKVQAINQAMKEAAAASKQDKAAVLAALKTGTF